MNDRYHYQGLGRNLQKDLLGAWYDRLSHARDEGRKVAYTFVPGNIAEFLRVFGFELVFPEINSLQAAIKKSSGPLILAAEDHGYSSDVCAYVKNDLGMFLTGSCGPAGLPMPRPDILLCSYTGCTTFIKWFEALSHFLNVPLVMLDVPFLRDDQGITGADRATWSGSSRS